MLFLIAAQTPITAQRSAAACHFEREQAGVVFIQMSGFALSDSRLLLIKHSNTPFTSILHFLVFAASLWGTFAIFPLSPFLCCASCLYCFSETLPALIFSFIFTSLFVSFIFSFRMFPALLPKSQFFFLYFRLFFFFLSSVLFISLAYLEMFDNRHLYWFLYCTPLGMHCCPNRPLILSLRGSQRRAELDSEDHLHVCFCGTSIPFLHFQEL